MMIKSVGMWVLLIGEGQGRVQLLLSVHDSNGGIVLSCVLRMWLVGWSSLEGCGAKAQLRSACYLLFVRKRFS